MNMVTFINLCKNTYVQYVNELNWKVLNPNFEQWTQMEKNNKTKKKEYAPNIYLPPFLTLSDIL